MVRKSFYILSCGFTFSTLNFKFSSTFVEKPLQISLFMQNKPNFRKVKMNVNKVLTKNYAKKTLGERGKKQSQTKPIKANFQKGQMFVTTFQAEVYENKSNWAICENKPNIKPIQTQTKPISPPRLEINDLLLTELANRKSRI